MTQPFSVRVATEDWRAEAVEWITTELARVAITVTGPIEQPRIRPWSTQLTVPTDRGRHWFKATCPSMVFEPALQQLMASLVPGSVQEPLAIDPDRGWMLTVDHGPTISGQRTATVDDWRTALADAARVQQALAPHRVAMLATGLPDGSPESVVERFDRLVHLQDQWPTSQLSAHRPELVDACAVLIESPLPATWNHGDLHQGNLFDRDGHAAFFDLGDGNWSSAIEILAVPYGVITQGGDLAWTEVVAAWRESWQIDQQTFDLAWRASALTHAVNRALTWHRALRAATQAEVAQWGGSVEDHLSLLVNR